MPYTKEEQEEINKTETLLQQARDIDNMPLVWRLTEILDSIKTIKNKKE